MLRLATTPLVVFLKHEEPFDGLNPSFKVMMKPLGTLDGSISLRIADMVTISMKILFSKLR